MRFLPGQVPEERGACDTLHGAICVSMGISVQYALRTSVCVCCSLFAIKIYYVYIFYGFPPLSAFLSLPLLVLLLVACVGPRSMALCRATEVHRTVCVDSV
jgi:hypothetical protein